MNRTQAARVVRKLFHFFSCNTPNSSLVWDTYISVCDENERYAFAFLILGCIIQSSMDCHESANLMHYRSLTILLPPSSVMHFYTRIEFFIWLRIPEYYNHAAIAQFSLPSFAYYLCGLYSLCVRLLWGPSTTYVVSQNDILDFILYVERHCPVSPLASLE